jgi:hypothetical protein
VNRLDVAAAQLTGSILDQAGELADRASSYPLWARILFVATLVLALASILVYALLFPTVGPEADAPSSRETSG